MVAYINSQYFQNQQNSILMGNKTCKACQTSVKESEIIANASTLFEDDFMLSELPNDQNFMQWLSVRKWDLSQGQVYSNCQENNKYFIGNWKNQVPSGRCLIYQPNIMLLDAQFVDGIPQGKAEVVFINQFCQYKGMLKHGLIDGSGKFVDHKQNFSFEGIWFNSIIQSGKLFLRKDKYISWIAFQNFIAGYGKIQYKDGRIYQGQIDLNTLSPHGKGVLTYPQNSHKIFYEGQFNHGKYHNFGKIYFKNGESYVGQYKNGKKQGKGKFIFTSEKYYDGQWQGDKHNGKGCLYDRNGGIIIKGIWKQGQIYRESATTRMSRKLQAFRPKQIETNENLTQSKKSPQKKINVYVSLQKATRQFGNNLMPGSLLKNKIINNLNTQIYPIY